LAVCSTIDGMLLRNREWIKTLSRIREDPSWILSTTRRKDLSEYPIATIVRMTLVFSQQNSRKRVPN
jgi:hypothetical protein